MSRRQGLFEDLVAIATKFPRWVAVLLAAASYVGLHYIAIGWVAAPSTPKAIGETVVLEMGRTLAGIFQYILPIAFLVGAVVSALGKRKRNALHERAAGSNGLSAIATMSWREFEMLIGEAFRRRGFRVVERGGQGAGAASISYSSRKASVIWCNASIGGQLKSLSQLSGSSSERWRRRARRADS